MLLCKTPRNMEVEHYLLGPFRSASSASQVSLYPLTLCLLSNPTLTRSWAPIRQQHHLSNSYFVASNIRGPAQAYLAPVEPFHIPRGNLPGFFFSAFSEVSFTAPRWKPGFRDVPRTCDLGCSPTCFQVVSVLLKH